MKTTKRSKMLLSSIAMLLVALVALGSATFAWYSITREVTAGEAKITATTPGGLQITTVGATAAENQWTSAATLENVTKTMNPAMLDFTGTTASTLACAVTYYDGKSSNDGTSSGSAKTPTTATDYYVVDEIWLRNTNAVDGTVKVTATATGGTNSYTNIVLVADDASRFYEATSGTARTGVVASGTQSTSSFDLTKAGESPKHFYVVAYVDGENANCKNTNAPDSEVSWNLSFTMTDKT